MTDDGLLTPGAHRAEGVADPDVTLEGGTS